MELKTYFAQDAAGNIIPSAIVNVFLQGTTTLATGLTRADGTPLENPFAADGAGRIQFRAPDGYYDVQVSAGPGIIQTLTIQCVDYSEAKSAAEQAQNALNSITGINTNFEQNSREQWRRSLAEAGLTLVSGSFEEGATVNSSTDAVWHIAGGQCYTWYGKFPKDIPAKSSPVGNSNWKSQTDLQLRSFLLDNKMVRYSLLNFGADPTGAQDSTAALMAADTFSTLNGVTILVPKGDYLVLNAQLGGSYHFQSGAYFTGTLGATDNMVVAKSGLRMYNPRFKKTLSNWAVDGDYGNAIRIGTYRQANDLNVVVRDVKIYNGEIQNIGTTYTSQSIEVLGNAYDITIDGMSIVGAGGGIICHWGGDVGDAGAHDSQVTYSYHPHRLNLSNFYFGPDSLGNSPANTLILSACYDVQLNNISSLNVDRTLWIFPGDVYNEVAVPRDKGKPCTGIVVNGVHIVDPLDNGAAIDVGGVPATKRTAQPTVYARDVDGNMDVTITGANITCADIVYTNPNVLIRACKGVKATINKDGGDRSTAYWAFVDYNDSCDINLSGTSVIGERLRGNTGCRIKLDSQRALNATLSGTDGGCSIESFVSGAVSVAAASSGATSIVVTSAVDGLLFNGAHVYIGGVSYGRITKTVLAPAGVATTVQVTPLNAAITAGASATMVLPHTGTEVTGTKKRHLYNYRVVNGWGLTLKVHSVDGQRGGAIFSGSYAYGCRVIYSRFDGTGLENSAPSRYDIHITATTVRGFEINGNMFDPYAVNPLVNGRIAFASSDHSGVIISNNLGTPTTSGVSTSITNSTVSAAFNMQQIYGNSFGELQAPIATVTGLYVGGKFRGVARNNATPTTGYWSVGDKVDRDSVVSGGQEGLVCTVAGSPGTWNGYGSIS